MQKLDALLKGDKFTYSGKTEAWLRLGMSGLQYLYQFVRPRILDFPSEQPLRQLVEGLLVVMADCFGE